MDNNIELIMRPDPHWSRADQLQLLRLLFGPRQHNAVCSPTSGQQDPHTNEPASSSNADGLPQV